MLDLLRWIFFFGIWGFWCVRDCDLFEGGGGGFEGRGDLDALEAAEAGAGDEVGATGVVGDDHSFWQLANVEGGKGDVGEGRGLRLVFH
jgi:hypothetical protein